MFLLVKLSKAFSWDKISQMLNDYPIMKGLCHSVGHQDPPAPRLSGSLFPPRLARGWHPVNTKHNSGGISQSQSLFPREKTHVLEPELRGLGYSFLLLERED